MQLVEITWVDAEEYGEVGWNCLKEIKRYAKKSCPVMKTVGYVLYESKTHISVVSSIGSEECSTVHKIPQEFIVSVREIDTEQAEDIS